MTSFPESVLPQFDSTELVLQHPTHDECVTIWNSTSAAWLDSLTPSLYLEESLLLTTVPLAKNAGMTSWILVQKNLALSERRILCSCESFRKHSLTSDADGNITDNIVHGIASVFCAPAYRRRGYAGRMMHELARELYRWQTDELPCVGSTLYSDIGKVFYEKLGWQANVTNSHLEFKPKAGIWPALARVILEDDVEGLCKRDEAIIRSQMAVPTEELKTRFTIIPDMDHMGWHIAKEHFAAQHLFGKTPSAKGAIAGSLGSQIWATWVRRYYGGPEDDVQPTNNALYILRLVVELDETATRLPQDAKKRPHEHVYQEQVELLKSVLQAAQVEAVEWKLDVVKLWDPTPLVLELLAETGLYYTVTERQEDSIASLLWYDSEGRIAKNQPLWVNNEHYAWQ
ncbi:hypothetical protein CC86DRAFT_315493 [Ophiobolus disseminans]|uniref:LYC1 C-terminal domain-containing protein n=1 Tax=Ophiobolus disseminans TaxID=1469910 RepID=A0A6A7ACK2_9PLEO|nr:hypothetical protein CC86DRAFT_315493 [Ophiobolus disseminans]